ncbi:MAG TPA: peptide-methionine (S)-S-oxide reductase, partial [Chitinophagaceae bacterium]|nr:peptide-methionine (S)-S-oxide reductase [Chitinophagaceae bacterium]
MNTLKSHHMKLLLLLTNFLVGLVALAACNNNLNPNKTMSNLTNTDFPVANTENSLKTDTATFGTGCFWCTEAVFQELDGVLKVTSGYSGGHVINPTYEQVCEKNTGHAEVVQIVYDPSKISFDELLE